MYTNTIYVQRNIVKTAEGIYYAQGFVLKNDRGGKVAIRFPDGTMHETDYVSIEHNLFARFNLYGMEVAIPLESFEHIETITPLDK